MFNIFVNQAGTEKVIKGRGYIKVCLRVGRGVKLLPRAQRTTDSRSALRRAAGARPTLDAR